MGASPDAADVVPVIRDRVAGASAPASAGRDVADSFVRVRHGGGDAVVMRAGRVSSRIATIAGSRGASEVLRAGLVVAENRDRQIARRAAL